MTLSPYRARRVAESAVGRPIRHPSLTGIQSFTKLVFSAAGTRVYGAYSNGGIWRLQTCTVTPASALAGCFNTGINTDASMTQQVVGNRLYSLRNGGGLLMCPINADGTLGVCVDTAIGEAPIRTAFTPTNAYLTTNDIYIRRCPIRADGTLQACVDMTDPQLNSTYAITLQ